MGDQISGRNGDKMTQTRGKTSQIELCRWISVGFVATSVALLALTLVVMFKNLEESRTVSEELLSRLEYGEKERKDLRRDLIRMRAKLQGSSPSRGLLNTLRKDSRVIRNSRSTSRRGRPKIKNCNHDHHEKENHNHHFCGQVKTCSLKQHTGSPVYLELKEPVLDRQRINSEGTIWDLEWRNYIPRGGGKKFIINDNGRVKVKRGGGYFVYCRVHLMDVDNRNPPILELMRNNTVLFSALPVSSSDATNNTVLLLQLFGLAEILANTPIYVRLGFTWPISSIKPKFHSEVSRHNFGMFLVDGR